MPLSCCISHHLNLTPFIFVVVGFLLNWFESTIQICYLERRWWRQPRHIPHFSNGLSVLFSPCVFSTRVFKRTTCLKHFSFFLSFRSVNATVHKTIHLYTHIDSVLEKRNSLIKIKMRCFMKPHTWKSTYWIIHWAMIIESQCKIKSIGDEWAKKELKAHIHIRTIAHPTNNRFEF